MRSPRGIPTSRAYWDLKADQMMNRIFDPEPTIDLEVEEEDRQRPPAPDTVLVPRRLPAGPAAPESRAAGAPRRDSNALLLTVLGGVCMVSAASSVLYLRHWSQAQQSLQQERNLLLVERLRDLGPARPEPAGLREPAPTPLPHAAGAPALPGAQTLAPGATATGAGSAQAPDLPPPPPEEPWMEQLEALPGGTGRAPVLRVPVSPRLGAAAPPAGRPATAAPAVAAAPVPELLGVVAAPGKPGSAIFQAGSTSSNVGVGETIGASGWRLRSVQGDAVTIERGGEVRRLSLGGGT